MNSKQINELLQKQLIPDDDMIVDTCFANHEGAFNHAAVNLLQGIKARSEAAQGANSNKKLGSDYVAAHDQHAAKQPTFQHLLELQQCEFKRKCYVFNNASTRLNKEDSVINTYPTSEVRSSAKKMEQDKAFKSLTVNSTPFLSPVDENMTTQPIASCVSYKPNTGETIEQTIPWNKDNRKCLFLGKEYQPSNWDVICGRGRHSYNHIGNRRFRIIVANNLQRYIEAKTHRERYQVSNSILKKIHEASPLGGFVKQDNEGNWYKIGEPLAQEKISHTFRDNMTGPLRRKEISCSKESRTKLINEAQNSILRSCKIIERSSAK